MTMVLMLLTCSFVELLYNKAWNNETQTTDLSRLSLADYASLFTVINPQDFCDNSLDTAFRVVNGFAFIMSVAAVFVVAVLPVGFQTLPFSRCASLRVQPFPEFQVITVSPL